MNQGKSPYTHTHTLIMSVSVGSCLWVVSVGRQPKVHSTMIHTHTHCVVALIENLREYFAQFGDIADCTVMYNCENKHRLVSLH